MLTKGLAASIGLPFKMRRTEKNRHYTVSRDIALIALFTIWPFTNFVANNLEYGSYHVETFWWFLGTLILALGTYTLLVVVIRITSANAALLVSLFVFSFFNLHIIRTLLNLISIPRFHTVTWGVCVLVISYLALKIRVTQKVYMFMLVFGSTALLMPSSSVVISALSGPSIKNIPAQSLGNHARFLERRNVYFFIFDGYGRSDQLASVVGHDNSGFLRKLNQLGFKIIGNSRSNYLTTPTSLSSTLSMRYLFTQGELNPQSRLDVIVSGDNETVREFKKNGYVFVHAPGGGFYEISSKCNPSYADFCISANWRISEISAAFFKMTPISTILNLIDLDSSLLFLMYSDLPRIMDELKRYDMGDSPLFLFAHLLMPHDPIFDAECQHNRNWYTQLEITKVGTETKPEQYVETLICLNRQIYSAMQSLIKRDPSAIIILQSDHRIHFDLPTEPKEWELHHLDQRAGILNAFRLPERCRAAIDENLSSVNTFRLVFACLRGETPDFLPNKTYLHWYGSNELLLRPTFQSK